MTRRPTIGLGCAALGAVSSLVLLVLAFTIPSLFAYRVDPPTGFTGAPGEETCADVGCHDSYALNGFSEGVLWFSLPGPHYQPGDTVTASLRYLVVRQEGWTTRSFALTVLDADGTPAGEILVTDSERTEIAIGAGGRTYLRPTLLGTQVDSGVNVTATWGFRWVAPQDSSLSPVVFYAAAVAANGDSLPTGDWVRTSMKYMGNPDVCIIAVTGDVNWDGVVNATDVIASLWFVFKGVPLRCAATADVDCSGAVTAADIISMILYIFATGPEPCDVCTLVPETWTCP